MSSNSITDRSYLNDDDFWSIRQLCVDTYPITGLGWNWELRRWDGARFHNYDPTPNPLWHKTIHLWETASGQLAGAANQDGEGWFYLQIHPAFRPDIEEVMISWCEENLFAVEQETGKKVLQAEVWDYDAPRKRILEARGYEMQDYGGMVRRMYLVTPQIPEAALAEGYTLAEIDPQSLDDCQRMANLLNAAFNRSIHQGKELQNFYQLAPSIRPDLHLVAAAPDGSFAAHVAAIYDPQNHRALYEPVCTHPDHRRKNLAQCLMFETMRRVKALGAKQITVDTGDMIPANRFYDAMGFTEAYKSHVWKKTY
jgi:GNAT superfamily N-acetyltransferase